MSKNNVRSFRFDDDVMEIINNFTGQNLTDKFDNLVRFCHMKVPETEKRLKEVEKQLEAKRKLLADLTKQTAAMDRMMAELSQAKVYVERVSKQAQQIVKDAASHN